MNNQPQIQPPPDAFIEPILKLREHYGKEVEKFELLHRQALENLNHVKALLGAWPADEENPTQASSTTISEPLVNTTQADMAANPDIAPEEQTNSTTTDDNITQLSFDWPINSTANTSIESPSPNNVNQMARSLLYSLIPMRPEYRELSRSEAILKLLKEHVGTVCHIDFIVRSLYGDLEPHEFKVVKGRVQSTLTQGREGNKWFAIPGQPGCYTLVLSLIPSTSGSSPKKANNKKSKLSSQPSSYVVPMLEPYNGQFLIDALTSLFKQNPGKVFNVAEVVRAIYGELDNEDFREVRTKVLNELSRGYRTGRFSKVPEQIGLYTWDTSLIIENT